MTEPTTDNRLQEQLDRFVLVRSADAGWSVRDDWFRRPVGWFPERWEACRWRIELATKQAARKD